MTNLKDLARMHLAYWEAFCVSHQKGKNNPPNLTKPSADAVMRPGMRIGVSLPSAFYVFFFRSCTLSPHQQ